MAKLNITKEELLEKYNKTIGELVDECDWITYISSFMVCSTIVFILLENKVNCFIHSDKLNQLYLEYIDSLNLSDGEWQEKYSVSEIIDIIYEILETVAE